MGRKRKLSEFANNENVSADILRAAIADDELSASLEGHIHYSDDGTILIDDDAAYVLHRYLIMSGISLSEDRKSMSQTTQKRLFIVVVILIFLYYMLAIVLEAMGKINTLGMSLMLLPVLAVVGIAYLRNKKKREDQL